MSLYKMPINYQPRTINCSQILKNTWGTYSQPQGKIYKSKALADIKEKNSNQQSQPENMTFQEDWSSFRSNSKQVQCLGK